MTGRPDRCNVAVVPNAFWVAREVICWQPDELTDDVTVTLHHDPNASMFITSEGVIGGERIELVRSGTLIGPLRERFPHLANLPVWTSFMRSSEVREILRGQIAISASRAGSLVDFASLQCAGVIDELCAYDGPLGVTFGGRAMGPSAIGLRLWAPTARNVRLHLFAQSKDTTPREIVDMTRDEERGVWSAELAHDVRGSFYLYEVEVYVKNTGRFERHLVTDPYSTSLGINSTKSQIVDVDDPALQPDGWLALAKPPLEHLLDSVVYELHVRDFSASDTTVPFEHRGRYKAFLDESNGTSHLRRIAEAGVTHLHLLPINDFATADDESREYNWGYDPLHWLTPEGSYAIEPDGASRILEVREMVAALNAMGLRVVCDVVFNHTFAAGEDDLSILDRIVPGYYHRLDADGVVATSSCCPNTASEHAMMERLIVDAVVFWATKYKIDGFRFDLMGHHMKRTMLRVRDTLRALTVERDGVDGSRIVIYGEGWDFGEAGHNARGENASQTNMAGTGIATFNDRMRDGIRGGNPFGEALVPGFATGLADQHASGSPRLRFEERRIESGLAAGLRDFPLVIDDDREVRAFDCDRMGLALEPLDTVNYAAAHDNETLFDTINLKAPDAWTADERVRMNNIAVSLIAMTQGLPFFHAGDELLRSKSCDRNSYDAGDMINRIDFSYATNNWGEQMPPEKENRDVWSRIEAVYRNPATYVRREHIERARDHFCEMLRVRRSSPLFRLRQAEEILHCVRFHDRHALGVVVMSIDRNGQLALVVFNARPGVYEERITLSLPNLPLHPVLQQSTDEVVKSATFIDGVAHVPARTTAVFLHRKAGL